MFELAVQQAAPRTADGIRLKRLLQRVRLKKHRQTGQGPLGRRRRSQRVEGRPDVFFEFGRDGDGLSREERRDPFRGPGALTRIVDLFKRLQRHWLGRVFR